MPTRTAISSVVSRCSRLAGRTPHRPRGRRRDTHGGLTAIERLLRGNLRSEKDGTFLYLAVSADEASAQADYDVVKALRGLGHEVQVLGIGGDLGPLRGAIQDFKPQIAFNLVEAFDDVSIWDANVVAYLELLKLPYTGCNSRGLVLARDKALAKKVLSYHRMPLADFAVFPRERIVRRPRRLRFRALTQLYGATPIPDRAHEAIAADSEALWIERRGPQVVVIKNAEAGDGVTDTIHKIRLWDKTRALEMLAKHFAV